MPRAIVTRILAVLLWACLLGRAHAEIPEPLRGQPIAELRVAGEDDSVEPPSEAGIGLGQRLTRELLRDATKKLLASGRFIDVQIDVQAIPAGARLIFHLVPRITLRRIDVSGNAHVPDQGVIDALGIAAGSEVETPQLEELAGNVRKLYAEHGYLGARVDATFRDTDDPAVKVLMINVDEAAPTRITSISFSGDAPRDPGAVLGAMGVSMGDVLDRRSLGESVPKGERLLRSHGFFEAALETPVLTIEGERASVAFPAHVGPRYTLEVRGATPLTARDVVDSLKLTAEHLSAQTLDAMPARVRDVYARHGFIDARVAVERRTLVPGKTATLTIRVQAGAQLEVVGIDFGGAHHFAQDFLRDQLESYLEEDLPGGELVDTVDSAVFDDVSTGNQADSETSKQRQVPRPMDKQPARTYYAPTYKDALKHITELYQAEGYLDVKVGPENLERVGATRATVSIPVVEGARTLIHNVVLRGQAQVSDRDLLLASGLTRNQPFSYLLLEEARLKMQELYQERGYMFVKIEPSVRFSRDRTRAEVGFQIVERFPVHIGEIVVHGAERTSTAFIRSVLKFHEGDLFQPSKARESAQAVQSLGVFTGVSVELGDPDLPARVKPVVVTVSERKNQFLDFTAGISTGQGVRGGFEYGYRNLFDHAVSLTLRVNFAYQLFFAQKVLRDRFDNLSLVKRLERNISLGTVIPRLPGLGSTRTNIDLVHVRDNERDFGLDKNGVSVGFTERPVKRVTLVEAADLENNNVDLFVREALNDYLAMTKDPRLRRLLRVPEGNSTLAALRTTASYDRRDSPFVPTKGFFVSAATEVAATLASQEVDIVTGKTQFVSRFLKLELTGSGYVPLGRGVVLAGQARVGRIIHLTTDSKTYPNRAFFLGGVDSMRAYFQDELIPQDVADKILADPKLSPNAVVRSGDAFLLLKGELRFPIYGQLGGGLFTDIGNLWANASKMNPFDLRPTVGAGIRLATPVGPIAVDYGIVLKRRRGLDEPFGTLQFSIGLF